MKPLQVVPECNNIVVMHSYGEYEAHGLKKYVWLDFNFINLNKNP